ncbi:alpha/beta hydrolase [Solimonas terrae]|uniref:Alpha/beta hydrolase n=1 Tax=Solimonas terrae TaxID=1396819 RepID=A0A6M2BT06_9GAMM|nr:alpha/beta hydrolase [Solimonas terrae]NGY05598.1 alpha/beta hydrolase [Solimonas terrae]
MTRQTSRWIFAVLAGALAASNAVAGDVDAKGRDAATLDVPAMQVPFSVYASAEARAAFLHNLQTRNDAPPLGGDIAASRAYYDKYNRDLLEKARRLYDVKIEHRRIGGVETDVVTPAAGVAAANRHRVLINLHGGAFLWGAGAGGQLEATPIAALMGVEVVTVDYREGPEHHYPAASEDVAAVYRELLKTHDAKSIGIYGCSAGGILTAESVAWLRHVGLPTPAAIGVFCGAGGGIDGDSLYMSAPLLGAPPVAPGNPMFMLGNWPYFNGASVDDPLVAPVRSPETLRHFPPTLLISGTRDFMMSAVIHQDNELVKAGVDTELHLWNGMWHAFFMDADLPESREAYAVIVTFFERHLR